MTKIQEDLDETKIILVNNFNFISFYCKFLGIIVLWYVEQSCRCINFSEVKTEFYRY